MDANKKIALSIVAIAIMIVVLASTLVVAFYVKGYNPSSINTNYNVNEIYGETSCKLYVGNSIYDFTTKNGDKKIVFAGPSEGVQSLALPNTTKIDLSKENDFAVFEFVFIHTNSWLVRLNTTIKSDKNVRLYATYSNTQISDFSNMVERYRDGFFNNLLIENVCYVYIKIKLLNSAEDASFEGQFEWDLLSENYYNDNNS